MQFGVREAARLLNVSEKTIYRWISQKKLPAYKIQEQYRFNRAELLEWATATKINVSSDIFAETESGASDVPRLAEALSAGGIHYRVGGADKLAVLKAAIDVMPLPEEVDKNFLLDVLVAREKLGSTAVGDGIALPHVRNPIVMHIPRPMITLCFLEKEVDFDALDGKPVHTLFLIVSPTVTAHLGLLSRLAFGLHREEFRTAIARQGSREEIVALAAEIDAQVLANQATAKGGAPL